MSDTMRILLAEDEAILAQIIRDLLQAEGYEVVVCDDGIQAWESLKGSASSFDAVLLDCMLPGLSGMEVLQRIKNTPAFAHLPVIMETALDDTENIRMGLQEGAYYYLTKPFDPEVLLSIVNAALQQGRERRDMLESLRRVEKPLTLLQTGQFSYRDLDEAYLLANYLARICPEPERVIQGMQELLVNAVEHGNLAISYQEKSELLRSGTWSQEIQRRLELPEFIDRKVTVMFERTPTSLKFTIRDQGDGFDWEQYLDFSAERAFDLHGRGIAMAGKLSFDRLEFLANGNTVVASVSLPLVPQTNDSVQAVS